MLPLFIGSVSAVCGSGVAVFAVSVDGSGAGSVSAVGAGFVSAVDGSGAGSVCSGAGSDAGFVSGVGFGVLGEGPFLY